MATQRESPDRHSDGGDLSSAEYITAVQDMTQIVRFTGEDNQHSEELTCSKVVLVPSNPDHCKCSSMVHCKRQVDYTWEHRYYTGQLLAVHMGLRFLAYGLKTVGSDSGFVRVLDRVTGQRGLIKGMEGKIQDLAFAHIDCEVLLAIVDERGTLMLFEVVEEDTHKDLTCRKILHVSHDVLPEAGCNHRVVWVPFLPDECEIDTKEYNENSKRLVLTLGTKAELWSVAAVISSFGCGPLKPDDVHEGFLIIAEHTQPIVDATFSPEGSALATVSLDGTIKFFQVYMQQLQTPRCLHNWRPHDGKPLSSIFFLDNHSEPHNPEAQFWKFVITGAQNNTELKVWSCVNWTCLQTIHFTKDPAAGNNPLTISGDDPKTSIVLKAGLDMSGRHLMLSDINNQAIYVLRIHVESNESTAYVCSASEFRTPFAVLSFTILSAGPRSLTNNSYLIGTDDNEDEPEEDEDQEEGILMYLIQPKSMQRCIIEFTPPSPGGQLIMSTVQRDGSEIKAGVDLDKDVSSSQVFDLSSSNPYKSSISLNLMTPDEFSTSPHKPKENADAAKDATAEVNVSDVFTQFPRELVSGGSSPSREVQEILSTNASVTDVKDLVNLSASQRSSFFSSTDIPQIDVDVSANEASAQKDQDAIKTSNGWFHIPMPPDNLKPSEELASRLTKRSSQEMLSLVDTTPVTSTPNMKNLQKMEANIAAIFTMVQQQETQIRELHQELARSRNSETVMANMFKRALNEHAAMMREQEALRDSQERDRQEVLKSAMSQTVGNLVAVKLEDIVVGVVMKNIMPAIVSDMDQFKKQLHMELTQKLSVTDHLLKDNIAKLVTSKSVMDVLAVSLAATIRPSVADMCKDTFMQVVIPRCEKALEKIFAQVHETFTQGTREYFLQIQKEMEKFRVQMARGTTMMKDYETTTREKLEAAVQIAARTSISQMQDNIGKQVTEAVRETISKELQTQKTLIEATVMTAVRSRAVTPASHVIDQLQILQSQIKQLVDAGQFNTAFQQALSASDLSLVVYLCDKLNPEHLFKRPCPLQQPVLLSLIQQLSADMTNHTDLKSRYLEEALMNLDVGNTMTKEHLPTVLINLQKQVSHYITNNSSSEHTRKMRRLLMMVQALIMGK